ncbi:ABC transporter ATP-binding protein [Chitinivorax sp. B]|uniref:ABC transporter ATP-binding protein n=1 Tax=Chitinivorax sp. B TaxID=2502235 RepID=UPI0010F7D95E|nr:ABC transporter ATP-binding protein [Chitinivorax sp. B]
MGALKIKNVRKSFGGTDILKGIDLEIDAGQFLILVGPSGCGKSTLLGLISGLEQTTTGEIWIGDRMVNNVAPKDRDIAMVFQSYALYPNMNVKQNIAFGMEMRNVPKAEQEQIIARVAKMLQIEHLLDRKPSQLSGGQRQRVAMGRALARNPGLFLFDEPLSNLDAKLRVEMRTEIKRLHERTKTTVVYVTHDQIEAMTLGDRIAVMKDGIIQQFGGPQDIYDNPANMFVAGFIGSPSMNFIHSTVVKIDGSVGVKVESSGKQIVLPVRHAASAKLQAWAGKEVIFGIRPEQITGTINVQQDNPHITKADCKVEIVEPTGPDTLTFINLNGKEAVCRVHPSEAKRPGEQMQLAFDMSKAVFFDPKSEARVA